MVDQLTSAVMVAPRSHGSDERVWGGVTVITPKATMSPFVVELTQLPDVAYGSDDEASAAAPSVCPACGSGALVQRDGKNGPFLGCSRFPACSHTESLATIPFDRAGPSPSDEVPF